MKRFLLHYGPSLVFEGVVVVANWALHLPGLLFGLIAVVGGIAWVLVGHFWERIANLCRRLAKRCVSARMVLGQMPEAEDLLGLKETHRKNPIAGLYPVIERIDLNRKGSAHDDKDIYVKFQIDSHLLHPIHEFYVFIQLSLSVPLMNKQVDLGWYDISYPNGHASIGLLERCSFGEQKIRLTGETQEEQVFLNWMDGFRKNNDPLYARAQIGVGLNKEEHPNPIMLKGSEWLIPANDYRGS